MDSSKAAAAGSSFRGRVKSLILHSGGFKDSIKGSDEQMDLKYNISPVRFAAIALGKMDGERARARDSDIKAAAERRSFSNLHN